MSTARAVVVALVAVTLVSTCGAGAATLDVRQGDGVAQQVVIPAPRVVTDAAQGQR